MSNIQDINIIITAGAAVGIDAVDLVITDYISIPSPEDLLTGTPIISEVVGYSNACFPLNILTETPIIQNVVASVTTGLPQSILTGTPIISEVIASFITAYPQSILSGTPIIASVLNASSVLLIPASATLVYLFEISGSQDGIEKVCIPISSFQSRRRSGADTYLSVVIPGVDTAGDIVARPNGLMSVIQAYEKAGEYLKSETIVETYIETIDIYDGPGNKSIVLTGYKQTTYTPKSVTLTGSIYRSVVGGKIRHRFSEPDMYLNPGDTLIVGTDEITVYTISYSVSVNSTTFEIGSA